jgi:hypothetical protein
MGSVPPLLTFLLTIVFGWIHRRQLTLIEFLKAESGSLKEQLAGKRISVYGRAACVACTKSEGTLAQSVA